MGSRSLRFGPPRLVLLLAASPWARRDGAGQGGAGLGVVPGAGAGAGTGTGTCPPRLATGKFGDQRWAAGGPATSGSSGPSPGSERPGRGSRGPGCGGGRGAHTRRDPRLRGAASLRGGAGRGDSPAGSAAALSRELRPGHVPALPPAAPGRPCPALPCPCRFAASQGARAVAEDARRVPAAQPDPGVRVGAGASLQPGHGPFPGLLGPVPRFSNLHHRHEGLWVAVGKPSPASHKPSVAELSAAPAGAQRAAQGAAQGRGEPGF